MGKMYVGKIVSGCYYRHTNAEIHYITRSDPLSHPMACSPFPIGVLPENVECALSIGQKGCLWDTEVVNGQFDRHFEVLTATL